MHDLGAAVVFLATLVGLAAGRLGHLKAPRGAIALVGGLVSAALLGTSWTVIDLDVIALLAGLMVLATLAADVGLFAPFSRLASQGPRAALAYAIIVLAACSALLLNDAAVVTLLPVLLVAVWRAGVRPVPAAALLGAAANVGSLLTPFGNPQNAVLAAVSGHGVAEFLAHQWPAFAIAMAGLLAATRLVPLCDPDRTGAATGSEKRDLALGPAGGWAAWVVGGAAMAFVAAALMEAPLGLSAALAAMGAFVILRLAGRPVDAVAMRGIDANVLALFVGFYLLAAGIPSWSAGLDVRLSGLSWPTAMAVVVAASNTVGNVPATLGLHAIDPAWTSRHAQFLVTVTALGGTLFLTGSAATLLAAEQARRLGIELSFGEYLRWSWPVLPALVFGAWLTW